MSYQDWKEKTYSFRVIDVRGLSGNFFPGLKMQAEKLPQGQGLHIVQTFEPFPLYEVMDQLGYERHTEKVAEDEYHVYFYRAETKEPKGDISLRPVALTNYPLIDSELGQIAVSFWNLTWASDSRYLPYETRIMLSMSNAIGAGRLRQATRELVKGYIHGIDSRAFDDIFEMVAWNQGIGNFSSEIGPSTLFAAYKFIKQSEKKGTPRSEICKGLREKFGENNPDVKVI